MPAKTQRSNDIFMKSQEAGTPMSAVTPMPLGEAAQRQLGLKLQSHYDRVLHEPIPDRFLQLLDQLAACHSALPQSASQDADRGHKITGDRS